MWGAARTCYEAALSYAKERDQFDRPIASFRNQQQELASRTLEVNRATLLPDLGRMKDAGTQRPERVSMGKLPNVNAALDVACEVLGANGVELEDPLFRHMNNLELLVTYEGTADVHGLVIGEAFAGIGAFR